MNQTENELAVLAGLAERAGGRVVSAAAGAPALRVRWADPAQRLVFLSALAEHDAHHDPRVRMVAAPIVARAMRASSDPWAHLAALTYAVQSRVAYVDEKQETFARPAWTWARRYGDCDDSAPLLASLVRSVGHDAQLVTMGWGEPQHVAARVRPAGESEWAWAETTIAAKFGEHPAAAKARM